EDAPVRQPADIVYRRDPGMLQPRQLLRLASQTRLDPGVGRIEHFQRNAPAQLGILDDVDRPHPTRARHAGEPVLRLRQVRFAHGGAQTLERAVIQTRHTAPSPSSARASSRNSSSPAVSSRSTSRTIRRSSRRTRNNRLVTSVTATPKLRASSAYVGRASPRSYRSSSA